MPRGAREMLERGDLGTPYYNGAPFLLKPILIYWVIAASFRLLGRDRIRRAPAVRLSGCGDCAADLLVCGADAQSARRLPGRPDPGVDYLWIDIARDAFH